ncbi:hypothetical protein HZS_7871 [Henneguya salminicola]|nr:hypothetical protein HZS_7871 [Henneguya salminicola]
MIIISDGLRIFFYHRKLCFNIKMKNRIENKLNNYSELTQGYLLRIGLLKDKTGLCLKCHVKFPFKKRAKIYLTGMLGVPSKCMPIRGLLRQN